MIIQLNPSIPLDTPRGSAQALFLIDYSMEHHIFWVCAIDKTGEIWTYANPEVRMQKNISLSRRLED